MESIIYVILYWILIAILASIPIDFIMFFYIIISLNRELISVKSDLINARKILAENSIKEVEAKAKSENDKDKEEDNYNRWHTYADGIIKKMENFLNLIKDRKSEERASLKEKAKDLIAQEKEFIDEAAVRHNNGRISSKAARIRELSEQIKTSLQL